MKTATKWIPLEEAEKIAAGSGISTRRVADIQAKPIRWLWRGRFARGKVSIIAGNPGLGKSQLALAIAATITTGGAWPANEGRAEPGSVLILSAEDDVADTIRPRLEAAGADLTRCHVLEAVRERGNDGKQIVRGFTFDKDLERLSRTLDDLKDVALVIVDPVTAYLGKTDSHVNAEVRALLAPLSDVAARHGVAVVCVSHLNKSSGGDALLRVMGSLAFVAAARAAYVVAKDQADPNRRLFLPAKNNIGNDQTGLAFAVRPYVLPVGIETSRIGWESEPVAITADEALAAPSAPEDRNALEDAKEFLSDLLASGSVSAKQVRADAEGAGHAWATIRRAKDVLGVKAVKAGMKGVWTWELPKVLNGAEDAQQKSMSPFGGNEHLRELPPREYDL